MRKTRSMVEDPRMSSPFSKADESGEFLESILIEPISAIARY
jgi:hypothetical protein